jgi:alkylated DNA repair protein alkB family protein 6
MCSHIRLFQAVNEIEALKHSVQDQPQLELEEGVQDYKAIRRTTNRISLTCRLVLKVHKKLFKF